MDNILVVDASPLIYAVYNSVGHLSSSKGEPTGLRYGFLRAVRSYQEKTKSNKVAIAFDSPGQIVKAEGTPTYKANRVFTDVKADMYAQVPALRETLKLTKWTQLDAPGWEADDLIGTIARAKGQRGHQVVVASSDNDLLQLVNDQVKVFRAGSAKKKTKDRLIDAKHVFDLYGVYPEYLCLYRAIMGDTSDNIPGVATSWEVKVELQNLTEKLGRRATPFTPDDLVAELRKSGDSTLKIVITVTLDRVRENFKIMSLPTPPNITIQIGESDRPKLEALFQELEFKSMFKYLDELTGAEPAWMAA